MVCGVSGGQGGPVAVSCSLSDSESEGGVGKAAWRCD